MPKNPTEPTNLVLEQLRLVRTEASSFRAEFNARLDEMKQEMDARFDKVEAYVSDVKRDIRGIKLNGIAEVYKANLTVANFVELEGRIKDLERKAP